ncbi:hypothetical protein ACFQ1S_14315 [Kibdelosporangium lantanae]|uniref:Uncharacterized protein n=1 Tax=Kibdelosporangium lantanae TaxID=1497396 RepID=A0ABW3M7R0_9PSEU
MDALLRLADEVGELGRRLDRISAELRTLARPFSQTLAATLMPWLT